MPTTLVLQAKIPGNTLRLSAAEHHCHSCSRIASRDQARKRRQPSQIGTTSHTSEAGALEAHWTLLQEYTRLEVRQSHSHLVDSPAKRAVLRAAVLAAASAPWLPAAWDPAVQPSALLIGIVSSDVRLAIRALRDCTRALEQPFAMPSSRVAGVDSIAAMTGACYVKYMAAAAERSYCTTYSGRDRGILLQLGQAQIGHLPLGLFAAAAEDQPCGHGMT